MTVFVDSSAVTFVYGCEECPWWTGIALSLDAAEEQAIQHEELIHGTQHRRSARDRRRARHADKLRSASEMVGSAPEYSTRGIDRGIPVSR